MIKVQTETMHRTLALYSPF